MLEQARAALENFWTLAQSWLLGPAAWSQFGLLIAAYGLSVLANRMIVPRLQQALTPPDGNQSILSKARRFILLFTPLLLPLIAYALTAAGEQVTRQLFGSMNIMGISLTSLAVIGGAVGVGIGFGLQQIASNFISGVILLPEGQATVGDFVELDGGESGQIVRMTARATVLKTFDGRQIMVPNEHFITTRVTNYSDSGSPNRYAALFSVSDDTDINLVPAIIIEAVSKHPDILQDSEGPDVELRGFGESGIDFACEFWVAGIDDGPNSYTSDVLFLIWNALKAHNIAIPFPHRVIGFKGQIPT